MHSKEAAYILVVEDEPSQRETLQIILSKDGHRVETCSDGLTGLEAIRKDPPDLVLSDIRMPNLTGLELLHTLHQEKIGCEIILLTAWANTEDAVEAMKIGAYDYLIKPYKTAELRVLVEKALEKGALRRENRSLKEALAGSDHKFIFRSQAMKTLVNQLERMAPMDATVVLSGESGVGKEVMARFIWQHSNRSDKNFIAVNCGAIPENLVESELFGYRKGAFTGANEDRKGLFEEADGGILFLDEIGELPLNVQVKLLRVLQERSIRMLGDSQQKEIDVRIVVATNRDLESMVEEGTFRKDLFYRINVFHFEIPPLRNRREDILPLAQYFCRKVAERYPEKGDFVFSNNDLIEFEKHDFPGNVRELENWVERKMLLAEPDAELPPSLSIDRSMIVPLLHSVVEEQVQSLESFLDHIESVAYEEALSKSEGNKTEAARRLGLSFRQFRYRYQKLFPDTTL